jgi:DNA-binding NarL/FixJ family response regulator
MPETSVASRFAHIPLRDRIVLVVSDNDTEISIMRQYLKEMQCGAIIFERTAMSAYATLRRYGVDVLVTRNELPDQNAFQLIQTLRVKRTRYKPPRSVVIYTVDRRHAAIDVLVQAQPDALLAWPFSLVQFRDRVEGAFVRKAAQEAPAMA